MEQMTKRILAIVLIAIIGTGIGIGAWFFLATPAVNPYEYPGIDGAKPPLSQTLKIGVLDDMAFTGAYSWGGAWIAAEAINEGGGVDIGGDTYYIGLVREDTKEASYDYDAATAAAVRMVDHDPHAILGGFRSEVFSTYIDRIMVEKIPFMITGAATTEFCQTWVKDSYPFYKYLFRCMPINSDHLGEHLGHLLPTYIIPNITEHQGFQVDKVRIVYEEIMWTERIKDELIETLNASFPKYLGGAPNVTVRKILTGWGITEFTGLWGEILTDDVQLVVPIISDATHGIMFGNFYTVMQPNCTVAGINVVGQISSLYWPNTGGACAYEIVTHGVAHVNLTERTIPFYDSFVDRWGATLGSPLYCSIGAGDAINLYAAAFENAGTFVNDDIVTELEKFNETNTFPGIAAPNFGFDQYHDVLETVVGVREGYFGTIYRQYHPDGSLALIPSGGIYDWPNLYPRNRTSHMIYPPWWPAA
jgi:ABC-type branched-subunit amino acid transport system substrate-binding protein